MLKKLARTLVDRLDPIEKEQLIRAVEPGVEKLRAAVPALEVAVAKAEEKVKAAEDGKEKLAKELVIANESNAQLRNKHEELVSKVREDDALRKKVETHPIYGKLLYDFGYKRVYASEPKRLADKVILPVWEKQRIFRPERAKLIAKSKTSDSRFGFPGVITIYDLNEPGKRGIVDGQHRIGGLEILLSNGNWREDSMLLTEVYTVKDHLKEVGDLFSEINQAQPMFEVDMPGNSAEGVKVAIDEASEIISNDFSEMFKATTRCRPPHLNIDNFRESLFHSEKARSVIAAAPPNDPEGATMALLAWIRECNARLEQRTDNEWLSSSLVRVKNPDALMKALEKCRKFKFFLGLDVSWL